jgi:hypothetical protein
VAGQVSSLFVGQVSIYLGLGDGTFQPPAQYTPTVQANRWIVAADFNGDGVPDLAFTNIATTAPVQVAVVFGNGDGTFQSPVSYATGTMPRSPVLADLNGDGFPDLVVANAGFGANNLSVMLGNGDGTFQPAVNYPTSFGAKSVAVGDVNNDGRPDLVVGNFTASNLLVFLGNGDGTFQTPKTVGLFPGSGSYVALADFNNDGKLDAAVLGIAGVTVMLGNGDGTFRNGAISLPGLGAPSGPPAFADLNGDGNLDIVVPGSDIDMGNPLPAKANVSVMLGKGDGTFQPTVTYAIGVTAVSVAIGDLNGDGKPDVVAADFTSGTNNTLANGINPKGAVAVLINNGDGTFQKAVRYAVSSTGAAGVVLADFDGDGNLDVASISAVDKTATVMLGKGDGTFQNQLVYGAGANPMAFAAADLNLDGKADLVIVDDAANTAVTLLNTYVAGGNSACVALSPLTN